MSECRSHRGTGAEVLAIQEGRRVCRLRCSLFIKEGNFASRVGGASEGVVGQKINYQACSQLMGSGLDRFSKRLLLGDSWLPGGRIVRGMWMLWKERHDKGRRCRLEQSSKEAARECKVLLTLALPTSSVFLILVQSSKGLLLGRFHWSSPLDVGLAERRPGTAPYNGLQRSHTIQHAISL